MRNKNRIKKLEQHINQLQLEVASLHMRVGAATAVGFEVKEMIQEDRAAAILLEDISAQEVAALRRDTADIKETIKADQSGAEQLDDSRLQEMAALRQDIAEIKAKLESSGVVDNWSIT